MKTTRLARRLGLDGNPLRRRGDKTAACLAALLVVVFLIGAPLLSVAAIGWAGRAGPAGQQAGRSWQPVPAAPLLARPVPATVGHPRAPARWTAPAGWAQAGQLPLSARLAAGHPVPMWATAAGVRASRPLNRWAVVAREAAAAAGAAAALGIVLLCLAWAGHSVLDRRRLAGWEAEWATGDSQWGKRFRSSG